MEEFLSYIGEDGGIKFVSTTTDQEPSPIAIMLAVATGLAKVEVDWENIPIYVDDPGAPDCSGKRLVDVKVHSVMVRVKVYDSLVEKAEEATDAECGSTDNRGEPRVRLCYFLGNETVPPAVADYDVVVIHYHEFRKWRDWAEGLQAAGVEVLLHAPAVYTRPEAYRGWVFDAYAVIGAPGAWLQDDVPKRVTLSSADEFILDVRNPEVARQAGRALAEALSSGLEGWLPDGLFLDCVWDRVAGIKPTLVWQDRAKVDADWKAGMSTYLCALNFNLRKTAWQTRPIYGNGAHSYGKLTSGICYEGWPETWCGTSPATAYEVVTGSYGMAWARDYFPHPPIILPRGPGLPGAYISPAILANAVATAAAYGPPGTVVVDNSRLAFHLRRAMVP